MTKWATVSNGIARRVTATKAHPDAMPVTYDPPDVCRVENEVRQKPVCDWIVGQGGVTVTYDVIPRDLGEEKAAAKDRARAMRKQIERGGITIDGRTVSTSEKAQTRAGNMVTHLMGDPSIGSIDFEVRPGEWANLSREKALTLGRAVSGHTQACMTHCRELHDAIDAAETVAEVWAVNIRTGWPGQ